jgi:GR25 family glycosyltransferase involved in LPS biosynthesis
MDGLCAEEEGCDEAMVASLLQQQVDFQQGDNVDANAILPSVECVRVISLNGSKTLSLLTGELKRLGLWSRTTVQIEQPDPEGGMAGCFRAHVRAWTFGQQCSNQLVLEDDAFFDNDTVDISIARAEAFLQGGISYDILQLGWSLFAGQVRVSKIEGADCAFQLHGDWVRLHAYVISNDAMQRLSSLEFAGEHIDVYLARDNDTKCATIRPMSAHQRYHKTAIPWSDNKTVQAIQNSNQKKKADPAYARRHIEDPVYQASGYGDLCAI